MGISGPIGSGVPTQRPPRATTGTDKFSGVCRGVFKFHVVVTLFVGIHDSFFGLASASIFFSVDNRCRASQMTSGASSCPFLPRQSRSLWYLVSASIMSCSSCGTNGSRCPASLAVFTVSTMCAMSGVFILPPRLQVRCGV